MDSPGKNTGVGFHFLLQEIFQTQGLNPGLLHCRQILYRLSHQESITGGLLPFLSQEPTLWANVFLLLREILSRKDNR